MIGSFQRNAPFGTEIAFAKGLIQLGVGVNTWDPSRTEYDDGVTLSCNAEATIVFKDHGEKTYDILTKLKMAGQVMIEYQPDDIRANGIHGMMSKMLQYCDYAFTFDESGAKIAEEIGYKKAKKLLVTADPELYRPLNIEKDIDFCFVGSMSNPESHKSRREMIEILRRAGYTVEFEQSMFDAKRINELYNRSKVVVNHATDMGQEFGTGYGYQCRHFEAGMSGACLLSNSLLDEEPDGPQQFVMFNSRKDLLIAAEDLIDGWYDGPVYEKQGIAFYNEIMTSHQPIHRAQEIVDFINGL